MRSREAYTWVHGLGSEITWVKAMVESECGAVKRIQGCTRWRAKEITWVSVVVENAWEAGRRIQGHTGGERNYVGEWW